MPGCKKSQDRKDTDIMNISEELIREIITKVVESAASEKKASDCGFEKHIDERNHRNQDLYRKM